MAATVLISMTIADERNKRSTYVEFVPATETFEHILAYAEIRAQQVDKLTGGVIERVTISNSFVPVRGAAPDTKAVAVEDSRVDHGVLFQFSHADTIYRSSVRIPAYLPTKIDPNGEPDTEDSDFEAFTNSSVGGIEVDTDEFVSMCDRYGNDTTVFWKAEESFRKP